MKTFEVFQVDNGAVLQSYVCDYFTGSSSYRFWIRRRWFEFDELVGTWPGFYYNVGVREKKI